MNEWDGRSYTFYVVFTTRAVCQGGLLYIGDRQSGQVKEVGLRRHP